MKKHEVWSVYVEKNPKFAASGSKITFTEVGVYQFFERTWELAHSEGVRKGIAQTKEEQDRELKQAMGGLFDELFGMANGKKY